MHQRNPRSTQTPRSERMSLGRSGSAHLHYRAKEIRAEPRSAAIRATGDDAAALQGHMLSYIDNAMDRFEQRQRIQDWQAIISKSSDQYDKSSEDIPSGC